MGLFQKIIDRTIDKNEINCKLVAEASCERPRMVRLCGKLGADVHAKYEERTVGYHALEWAAKKGDIKTARVVIEELGYADQDGLDRALQMVQGRDVEAFVDLLVDNGANVHDRDDIALSTAYDDLDFKKAAWLVLRHGADPTNIDAGARDYALKNGEPELQALVRLLPWKPNNRYLPFLTG